jgi:hypothetical protein
MTTYLHVTWHQDFDNEPVELYSEQDDEGWQTRKVDIYRDGRMDYADERTSTGTTFLAEIPVGPIEEIAADPQFSPRWISSDEFERQWTAAVARHADDPPA